MFIRSRTAKGTTYYQVIATYRDDDGKVRHRTVLSIGRHPTPAIALAAARKALARTKREIARMEAWGPLPHGPVQAQLDRARRRIGEIKAEIEALLPLKGLQPGPRVRS